LKKLNIGEFFLCFLFLFLIINPCLSYPSYDPVINRYGNSGIFATHSGRTLEMGRLVFSVNGNMSLDKNFVGTVIIDSINVIKPKGYLYNLTPALSLGLAPVLDFTAFWPLYIDKVSRFDSLEFGKGYGGIKGGFGDLELAFKLMIPPRKGPRVLDMAYILGISIPTGNKQEGFFPRHPYYYLIDSLILTSGNILAPAVSSNYSSGITEGLIMTAFTFNCFEREDYIPLMIHLNLGGRMLLHRGFNQGVLFNLGIEYRPADWVSLFSEASCELRLSNILKGFKIDNDYIKISPGFSFHMPEGLFLSFGTDISLSSRAWVAYNSQDAYMLSKIQPDFRIGGSIGWQGFLFRPSFEKKEKKPKTIDADLDKIPDSLDKCPNEPEDYDGYQDNDGCPDYDNDKDGVADSLDKCPGMEEDKDGFEDNDGCPDFDNDLDGIPDSLDNCPNEFGSKENNGCPQQKIEDTRKMMPKEIKRGRLILQGVSFKENSADLTPESYEKLDVVYESLKAFPEVKIEICGFTDNRGNPAHNKKLSLQRAETVRAYLILRGIEPFRIIACGKGQEDPIADNNTPQGRALNCRIEMRRID